MNWLRNDYTEQVDNKNNSDKHVDAISDSEKLVLTRSNPQINPSSDVKVANHTNNRHFTQKSLINPTIRVVIGPNNLLITADVVGIQEILNLRQKVLLKANVMDAVRSCTCILRTPAKVNHTEKNSVTPRDVISTITKTRFSS